MFCAKLTREQSNKLYLEVLKDNDVDSLRKLCRYDLFFLLTIAFKRKDINRPWLYERCREVEQNPDGYLDLWSREHYKSTVITYGKGIQDILSSHGDGPDPKWNGQETTMGIFSHVKPIAKDFLNQIKRELEDNTFLQDLFPDVLYKNPKRESPVWSLDNGLVVRRRSNPKEKTVEAHGLIDGQPTGKHFLILNYDDVVTRESVTTPDQIAKVNSALELSYNLGANGGVRRFIGTRYHFNDTYRMVMERKTVIPRIYPATKDGTATGEPVLLDKKTLEEKRRDMGPYTFACQMLQNPKEDSVMGFEEDWLRFYYRLPNYNGWNLYILVDPAGEKKSKRSSDPDYTVMVVIGLAPDRNYYFIDGIRDRLKLTERTNKLFEFHRKYKPLAVGYEKYGKDSDVEHVEYEMEIQNYRFNITSLGGATPKNDRIRKLVPLFEQGRFWLPHKHLFITSEGKAVDYIKTFIDKEYTAFPVAVHDDMLDCKARIVDKELGAVFPELIEGKVPFGLTTTDTETVQTEYNLFG